MNKNNIIYDKEYYEGTTKSAFNKLYKYEIERDKLLLVASFIKRHFNPIDSFKQTGYYPIEYYDY